MNILTRGFGAYDVVTAGFGGPLSVAEEIARLCFRAVSQGYARISTFSRGLVSARARSASTTSMSRVSQAGLYAHRGSSAFSRLRRRSRARMAEAEEYASYRAASPVGSRVTALSQAAMALRRESAREALGILSGARPRFLLNSAGAMRIRYKSPLSGGCE